jgi:hypothetical protein
MPAEIILIGGASILINYGFRDMTYDVDAVIMASSAMKDAVGRVAEKRGLPTGWLNTDFKQTKSYSDKLLEVSAYYRTFSNVVAIRTITAEYLVAMKLMSGRRYKHDISDIVGILWEHQKSGKAISKQAIENAIAVLYGDNAEIPPASQKFMAALSDEVNYEALFKQSLEDEKQSRDILLDFEQNYPNILDSDNTDNILERLHEEKSGKNSKNEQKD